jgi:dGTPase
VYYSDILVRERESCAARVGELFEYFLLHPEHLPDGGEPDLIKEEAPVHRRVCDYIAGMTDGYFRRIYSQYLGSISGLGSRTEFGNDK